MPRVPREKIDWRAEASRETVPVRVSAVPDKLAIEFLAMRGKSPI